MKIGIAGGALQGMEAAFLSGKAGFETLVVDRRADAPASSLADHCGTADIARDPAAAARLFSDCDAVIPALEEMDALESLARIAAEIEKPLLFDMDAYRISCSKAESNRIMGGLGVPLPRPWPECGFPAIVKPSSQSGSVGVSAVESAEEMARALKRVEELGDEPVVQEFVSGKSVSIEVIGNGSSARPYVTTEVILDGGYDCKRVACEPGILGAEENAAFAEMGRSVAEAIGLRALMDVEAIATPKGLRVLEIDARIPSQTPAAVEAATGINLMEELALSALGKAAGARGGPGCSSYEHYVADCGRLATCGEKKFAHVSRPRVEERFFGADVAITDYAPGKSVWRATVINSGRTPAEVLEKRKRFIGAAMSECDLEEYWDASPRMV
ncbi:MAG: 3-methylornithine--L-lysine ligase PylC [Candidatus Methanoplasma sp.]|jgi:pyrrolysine biosynthesis protein PylC|nr:3-methylornithine--L-lysine ligase PylC [Candidatus Methanoplasma sp.]